jgi:hypothetical protein
MAGAGHKDRSSSSPEPTPPFWLCAEEHGVRIIDARVLAIAEENWQWAFCLVKNILNEGANTPEVVEHVAVEVTNRLWGLFLKRAVAGDDPAASDADARRGEEILLSQIKVRGDRDAYPYEALMTHKLRWLLKRRGRHFREELEALYEIGKKGYDLHSFDERVHDAYQRVFREYLLTTVTGQLAAQGELPLEGIAVDSLTVGQTVGQAGSSSWVTSWVNLESSDL